MSNPEQASDSPPAPVAPRRGRRWLRWIGGLGIGLAAFAIAGFFALPALIRSQVPQFAEEKLKRKASIGEVRINPFTLRVEVHDFALTEADGRPIAAFGTLIADLDWSSITRRAWHLTELRLAEPKSTLDIAPDGRINLAELIDDLTRDTPKEERAELPRLVIDALVIERGRADLSDRHAGYRNTLAPIDLRIDNLSTLPQDRGPYTFSAKTARGGMLRWKGELSLNPLAVSGELRGEALSLPELSAYLTPYTTVELGAGTAGFVLPYRAAYSAGKLQASIADASFNLDELALRAGGGEPFLSLKSLRASKLHADYAKREIALGELSLDEGKALAKRDAQGAIDLLGLVKASPVSAATAPPPAAASPPANAAAASVAAPWTLKVERFSLDNFALGFTDLGAADPVSGSVERLKISASLDARVGSAVTFAIHGLDIGAHNTRLTHGRAMPARIGDIALSGGEIDLEARRVAVARVALSDGQINVSRNADGQIDLLKRLQSPRARAGNAVQSASAVAEAAPSAAAWNVKVDQFVLDNFGIGLEDRTARKPMSATIGQLNLKAGLEARTGNAGNVAIHALEVGLRKIALGAGTAQPVKIGEISLGGGELDLAARSLAVTRIGLHEGQLQVGRDGQGHIDLLDLLPGAGSAASVPASASPGKPWKAGIAAVALNKFTLDFKDEDTGVALQAQDISVIASTLSTDPKQAFKFTAGLSLREGGKLALQGRANPSLATLDAHLKVDKLALKPAQSVLARHVKLKLEDGAVSAKGDLSISGSSGKAPLLRYTGEVDVENLRLDETSGVLFASWKNVGAEKLTLSLQPNHLEVPELRVVDLDAKLLIEADRTLNATRLLVRAPQAADAKPAPGDTAKPAPSTTAGAPDTADPFPINVRRVRVQNGQLEFSDQSLRPQFAAKIHELKGVINGLSSDRTTRSQIELDGRVDEFGLARIRGELNPFAPLNNTDVLVVFRNVDLISASPYAMKFAGYRIAGGKISLDLKYTVRNSRLEGQNKIVLDQLVLGERVKSPDAFDLPLELALAVLTDTDGKIDLDLPISGSFDDPQFSYGAVIWKAITNVLTRIITAPFRALGSLFGVSGDSMSSIDFEPGSAQLLPPEREKLKQVATALSKRAQLKLSAPGSYNDTADGQALRLQSARLEIAQRAGIKVPEGEAPGPPDLQDRAVHEALRAVLTAREGAAAWDKRKAEAEAAAKASGASISILQRGQRLARGDPQVADLAPFYRGILERTVQTQPLAPDALAKLAARRSDTIVSALKTAGIAAERLTQPAAQKTQLSTGNAIPLKLGLSSR